MNVAEDGIVAAVLVRDSLSCAPLEHAVSNPSATIADDPACNALMRFAISFNPSVELAAKARDVNQLPMGMPRRRCRYTHAAPAGSGRRKASCNGAGPGTHSFAEGAAPLTTGPNTKRGAHIMSINSHARGLGRTALWAVAAAAAVTTAPIASANPAILPTPGNGPASVAVQQLESAGYNVSINWLEGHPNVPLSDCKVTSISGLKVTVTQSDVVMMSMDSGSFDTVYVDVACPNAK